MKNSICKTVVNIMEPGTFSAGCNYWASHAGTAMWRDWRPEVVEADLRRLAASGIRLIRVFPLWPDFQPLEQLRSYQGQPREMVVAGKPMPYDESGVVSISEEMMGRFEGLVRSAERHGLALIPALITGWMSGRMFVPPAFDALNVITDPLAIRWQVNFARTFVKRFKREASIIAWDLGNECNCMGAGTRDQAWLWTHSIAGAIRIEDPSRSVISGMHSLQPGKGAWTIEDQAELTDALTVHPYPVFTPHCDRDPVDTMRPLLHAVAEARFYADIGGRPCLVEETGTLGPLISNNETAGRFARSGLLSAWAHDARCLLWWCAFDQDHLNFAPYDWAAFERELGLFKADGKAKPAAKEVQKFSDLIESLPIKKLPARTCEAVCILTPGQDAWGAAFGAFILAKQAGFDITFQYADQPLKPGKFYIVPSIAGDAFLRRDWLALLERVRAGATLYVSGCSGLLHPFNEPLGLEIVSRQQRQGPAMFKLDDVPGSLCMGAPIRLNLATPKAEVLGAEDDGNPIFTRTAFGKGQIYYLAVPLETNMILEPGSFTGETVPAYWKLYQRIAGKNLASRIVRKENPLIGVTEHPLKKGERLVVAINYSPKAVEAPITLKAGWSVGAVLRGEVTKRAGAPASLHLPANDGAVFKVCG
jgi:hypothetical protein